VDNRIPTSL
jgi:hypothetical protein